MLQRRMKTNEETFRFEPQRIKFHTEHHFISFVDNIFSFFSTFRLANELITRERQVKTAMNIKKFFREQQNSERDKNFCPKSVKSNFPR